MEESVIPQPPTAQAPTTTVHEFASVRTFLRGLAGVGGFLALMIIWLITTTQISRAELGSASAVQITQIYAEAVFNVANVIGVMLTLYILSRAGE